MKNRFLKMGKSLLGAACVLSTCMVTYSCSDDYDLPDTKPGFLGGSIYDELKARGDFNTVVRLIDDLEYAEVLAKTGSKTLFVATDASYNEFFQTTKWLDASGLPVRSYDQLTLGQKKLLLNGTMLNNAYVMEMLSNTANGGKNLCLRQQTAATAVDTVPYFSPASLPVITNPDDKNFWAEYTDGSRKGIYMALDRTQPYMTHFLEGNMNYSKIKKSDVALILNQRGTWADDGEDRSYIYNRRVVEQDVTCLNGYFNVLDGVLVPPSNMAEEIRMSGVTNHFSRILDRFSAPFYSPDLTQEYAALHDIGEDSVFQKRYFSERSQGGNKMTSDPDGEALANYPFLPFDPGWNTLTSSSSVAVEQDMAAMFVPNDEAMLSFFQSGQGATLIQRYAGLDDPTQLTHENLGEYADMIPLNIVRALVANLMKNSFNESVLSKYKSIMNDARDPMFSDYDRESYMALIDSCLLANNGVVYITNKVISPADYAAVSAPVLISGDAEVINKAITIDDGYVNSNSYTNAPLMQYFSTYLKSMQSSFSFFVPTDSALADYGYVDPARFNLAMPGMDYEQKCCFTLDTEHLDAVFPIEMGCYEYNYKTDELKITRKPLRPSPYNTGSGELKSGRGLLKARLLIEMINQHIIVHENDDMVGVRSGRKFYESRGGAPVVVYQQGVNGGFGMKVGGGFQEYANTNDAYADQFCTVTTAYDQSRNNGYGNGMTYFLDRPIEPTYRSVYRVLEDDADYSAFRSLVMGKLDLNDLEKIGLRPLNKKGEPIPQAEWEVEALKYQLMVESGELTSMVPAAKERLVRFFNNYRYTIYVPTNDKMQDAIDNKGLPTWESITDFIAEKTDSVTGELTVTAQDSAQAMLMQLLNTLRYHFQDKAVYVEDNVAESALEEYQTSSLDEINEVYRSVSVDRTVAGSLKVNGVNVTDKRNILARDINFNEAPSPGGDAVVKSSSAVVLHQIDGMLDFENQGNASANKRYSDAWSTPAKAKAFVAKYKISK